MSDNNTKAQTPENNKPDPLGYNVYASTLWTRIQAALNKDHGKDALGDDPLVVGIFGEWGAGKSHLLKLLLKQARATSAERVRWRERDGGAGFDLTVPVLFQPWKYEHEEHLLVPLMLHIFSELKKTLKEAQSFMDKADGKVDEEYQLLLKKMGDNLPAISDFVEEHFGEVVEAVKAVLSDAIPGFGVASKALPWVAKKIFKKGEAAEKPSVRINTKLKYENDGRHYYDIHETLKAITRPNKDDLKALKTPLTYEVGINFVIFIDDLDRCLPEKAVQTLELIKTVFNVESFAFVLALDDEVIERGIGHRYKEYKLQDKKPEMPITGFEYLEKIVHLPFRLPALTRSDAVAFLATKEIELRQTLPADSPLLAPPYPDKWFAEIAATSAVSNALRASHEQQQEIGAVVATLARKGDAGREEALKGWGHWQDDSRLNLALLVVGCFEAYVPRKLLRVLELYYQVLQVSHARGRHILPELGSEGRDPRVVLALVLLQLFQPDLYRTMKRVGRGFDEMREAFAERQLSAHASDLDLLAWACFDKADTTEKPVNAKEAMLRIAKLGDSDRPRAQRVRLPVVEKLLEHRAAQRHVFDPLRLFQALQETAAVIPLAKGNSRSYYSLLSLSDLQPDEWSENLPILKTMAQPSASHSGKTSHEADTRPRQEISDVKGLYFNLISSSDSEQEEFVKTQGLQEGHVLGEQSTISLLIMLQRWLSTENLPSIASTTPSLSTKQNRSLRGLQYLAPHISREYGESFWNLVKDTPEAPPPTSPNQPTQNPALTSLYMNVRSMLGQDKRFEPTRCHLPKDRWNSNTEEQEPIPGFVRLSPSHYQLGREKSQSNPPRTFDLKQTIYVARMLTTVDQFSLFVNSGGYDKKNYWHPQGWAWLTGELDSTLLQATLAKSDEVEKLPSLLRKRPVELRRSPMRWEEQLKTGSRAVHSLTWFEAHAYTNWLSDQLEQRGLLTGALSGYRTSLPNELHWECAARFESRIDDLWPWGNDEKTAHQRANIQLSLINHSSVPGCFAPNRMGLLDMAGNLWEWQSNLYSTQEDSPEYRVLAPGEVMVPGVLEMSGDWDQVNVVALRGGGWMYPANISASTYRGGDPIISTNHCNGFRVVLCPA